MLQDGKLPADEGEYIPCGAVPASAATKREPAPLQWHCHERSFLMLTRTKKLALNAVLAAMVAVLGYFAVDAGSIKITFESLPIVIAALVLGPLNGLAVGAVGTFIYQTLRYGIMITTPMWMVPYAAAGFICGLYSRHKNYAFKRGEIMLITALTELVITLLNTGALYIDSHIYGYYQPMLITGMLIPRFAICVIKTVLFSLILPSMIRALRGTVPTHR